MRWKGIQTGNDTHLLHHWKNPRLSILISVCSNAEVHFLWRLVCLEGVSESIYGVLGSLGNVAKVEHRDDELISGWKELNRLLEENRVDPRFQYHRRRRLTTKVSDIGRPPVEADTAG